MPKPAIPILFLAILGCFSLAQGSPPPEVGLAGDQVETQPSPNEDHVRTLTPTPSRTYIEGPTLLPHDALLEWLEETQKAPKGPKMIRLPVVVVFRDEGMPGIAKSYLGTLDPPTDDPLFIELDGNTLGISLMDQLRSTCPSTTEPCALWLDGHWGRTILLPGEDENALVFTVRNLPNNLNIDARAWVEE